jgi:hypothetical protein
MLDKVAFHLRAPTPSSDTPSWQLSDEVITLVILEQINQDLRA